MNRMIKDIIIKICAILCDRDKNNFLSTTKKKNRYKQHIFFNEDIIIQDIIDLPYFDSFTSVNATSIIKLPKNLIRLGLGAHGTDKLVNIPKSVTHLTLWYQS